MHYNTTSELQQALDWSCQPQWQTSEKCVSVQCGEWRDQVSWGELLPSTLVGQDETKVYQVSAKSEKKSVSRFPGVSKPHRNCSWAWSVTEGREARLTVPWRKKYRTWKLGWNKLLCLACQESCGSPEKLCTPAPPAAGSLLHLQLPVKLCVNTDYPKSLFHVISFCQTCHMNFWILHVLQKPHGFMEDFVQSWHAVRIPGVSIDL